MRRRPIVFGFAAGLAACTIFELVVYRTATYFILSELLGATVAAVSALVGSGILWRINQRKDRR